MSSQEKRAPLFQTVTSSNPENENEDDNFEDEISSPISSSSSLPVKTNPFSFFNSSFLTSSSGEAIEKSEAKAGVVEGEEDEDDLEMPASTDSPSLSNTDSKNSGFGSISGGFNQTQTAGTSKTGNLQKPAATKRTQKTYTKSEKKVVAMNHSLRKAPVKKLKETFAEIRSELSPTQTSLSASIRTANEASAASDLIDERLSALNQKLANIGTVFHL